MVSSRLSFAPIARTISAGVQCAVALAVAVLIFATPGQAQDGPPSPPPFSVIAPTSATLAVTSVSGSVQVPNSTSQWPSVLIVNDGSTEVFVSIGGSTVTATACASTTGTCASTPIPAGQAISGWVGLGYIAAITGSSTSVVRVVQFNGAPWFIGGGGSGGGGGGSATAANQTNGSQKTQIVDGSGNVIASTSNNLNVQCANCSGSGVSAADEATFTAGMSLLAPTGGFYQTTATSNALTNGQQGMWQMTANRAGFVNLRTAAGAEIGTSASPVLATISQGGNSAAVSAANNLNVAVNLALPAGTNLIGKTGIDQTTAGTTNGVAIVGVNAATALAGSGAVGTGSLRVAVGTDTATIAGSAPSINLNTINGANTYNTVAASQTAQALTGGSGGATGDYLSHCTVVPTSTSPGVVTILDNATTIYAFPGGASSLSNLVPFSIPVGAKSTSGAWKVTTGASLSVVCVGKFT